MKQGKSNTFISFISKNYLRTIIESLCTRILVRNIYKGQQIHGSVSLIFTWIPQVYIKGQTPFDGPLTMEKTVIKSTSSCQHFDNLSFHFASPLTFIF